MNRDLPTVRHSSVDSGADAGGTPSIGVPGRRAPAAPLAEVSRLALEIRQLVDHGEMDQARERFGELVAIHQRRASRIAFQYLRDHQCDMMLPAETVGWLLVVGNILNAALLEMRYDD